MASTFLFLLILVVFLFEASAAHSRCGPVVPCETPICSVFSREFGYELRDYPAGQNFVQLLMYNTTYEVASTSGFIRLAAYVKGDNALGLQMPTTLPFIIHPVPDVDGYIVGLFLSPSVTNPPLPFDKGMKITQTSHSLQAVLPFSGSVVNETSYLHNTRELLRYLQRDNLFHNSWTVSYARYTFPFPGVGLHEEGVAEVFISQEEVHVEIKLN